MSRFRLAAVLFLLTFASIALAEMAPWPWSNPAPEVDYQFEERGEELLVGYDVTINNSPAIVDCHAVVDEDSRTVALHFSIIQNRDLFRRSLRQQPLSWRVPKLNADRDQYKFELHGSNVVVTTKQLNTIRPGDSEG